MRENGEWPRGETGSDPRQLRRVVVASAVGSTIEWYDFFIFGTASALIFGAVLAIREPRRLAVS